MRWLIYVFLAVLIVIVFGETSCVGFSKLEECVNQKFYNTTCKGCVEGAPAQIELRNIRFAGGWTYQEANDGFELQLHPTCFAEGYVIIDPGCNYATELCQVDILYVFDCAKQYLIGKCLGDCLETCYTTLQSCEGYLNNLICAKDYCICSSICEGGIIANCTQCENDLGICNTNLGICNSDLVDCQNPSCTQACVNGNCVATDVCQCNVGWEGSTCTTAICAVGCHNGDCIGSPGTCTCSSGWTGILCDTPVCVGGCGSGTCTSPGVCTCDSGYIGLSCNEFTCFGVPDSTSLVCGGHGDCTGVNTCSCFAGYSGTECKDFDCFGLTETGIPENAACNGIHGICKGPDDCDCNIGYTGTQCENPIAGILNNCTALVALLELEVLDLEQQILNLQGQLATCQADVASLNVQISNLNILLTQCNSDNSDLNAQVTTLLAQVDSLNTQVATLQNDLSTCNADLTQCQTDLGTCPTDLTTCQTGLLLCDVNFAVCQQDLAVCSVNLIDQTQCCSDLTGLLSTCNSNLGTCNTNLGTCNSNLGTCTTDLGTCNSDLGTCNSNLFLAQGQLNTCNANLGTCESELLDCQTVECSTPCSTHGTCVADDTCKCKDGYWGDLCDQTCPTSPVNVTMCQWPYNNFPTCDHVITCFGVRANERGVCGWHGRIKMTNGVCVEEDTCVCYCGWIGEECKYFNYNEWLQCKDIY